MFLLLFLIRLAAFYAAVCVIFFFFLTGVWNVLVILKHTKPEWSIKYGWPQTGRIMRLKLFMQLETPTPNNPLPPFVFYMDFITCSEIKNVLLLNTNFIQGVVQILDNCYFTSRKDRYLSFWWPVPQLDTGFVYSWYEPDVGLVVGMGVWAFTEMGNPHLPSHWAMTKAQMHVEEIVWGALRKEGHETQGGEQTES